ncbi:hypothetical protein KDL01_17725 [Actinospica durhamensis]|uniref:Uncharacterized protein n=1 Tax=Actinospica durhamensis TaxID=1508375 RepID=A0A941EQ64_9ACTN|nr:hypothetical protein [Actinospica durhamensis]MBR7835118.1 hypothetical protein [Actinospica durhamensis]
MGEEPNEDQPTVPAWARPPAGPEPTAPLPELPPTAPIPDTSPDVGQAGWWPGADPGAASGGYGAAGQAGAPYPGYPEHPAAGGYAGSGGYPAVGGYPGPAGYGAAQPPQRNGGRTAVAIISVLAVLGTAVAAVVYSTGTKNHSSPVAFQNTGLPLPTGTANPLVTLSPSPDGGTSQPAPASSEPGFDSPSAEAFDWDALNDGSTDPTPFTQDALLPQSFVDSQNITYALEAAGEKKCVQSTMAQDVQDVLNKYGCKDAMTGSYLEDASVEKVSSNNDILVSVQIWPFSDTATADKVERALADVSTKQFSIWCPTTGQGAAPCNSQNYYSAASWWSLQSEYRYVIEATAVYTNMTQDTSVAYKWEKTATAQAIKEAGPQVYAADQ